MKKKLDTISRRYSINQVFDDFLKMAVCAFSMGRMETEYKEIAKRYTPEDMQLFGEALGAMVMDYDAKSSEDGTWCDVLGAYFEDIQSHFSASAKGQFFTPDHVCDLMAKVLGESPTNERIYVNDCACGSGRNLIAHSRTNTKQRFSSFYVAQDVDYRCVLMSVINFLMFGMSGVVIHMNTITMTVYRGFRVMLPETGLFVYPLTEAQCMQYVAGEKAETKPEPTFEQVKPRLLMQPVPAVYALQLSLF
jgi:hypothetical protein